MSADDAIAKMIIDKFDDSSMLSYYKKLLENNGDREIKELERRIRSSPQSMCMFYVNF